MKKSILIILSMVLVVGLMIGSVSPQYADTGKVISELTENIAHLMKESRALYAQVNKILEPVKTTYKYNSKIINSDCINISNKKYINIEVLSSLLEKSITFDDKTNTLTIKDMDLPDLKTKEEITINDSIKSSPPREEEKEIIVYITKTGSKYHTGGCRYLSKSKIPISLNEAKKYYTPCSVCNPPR